MICSGSILAFVTTLDQYLVGSFSVSVVDSVTTLEHDLVGRFLILLQLYIII